MVRNRHTVSRYVCGCEGGRDGLSRKARIGFQGILISADLTDTQKAEIAMNFYDIKMRSITGEELSFDQYKGQVCLAVNLASQ